MQVQRTMGVLWMLYEDSTENQEYNILEHSSLSKWLYFSISAQKGVPIE